MQTQCYTPNRRRVTRTHRPVAFFIATMAVCMLSIGTVAVAAVL